ncbi:hypothetical protein AAFC00_006366 [Neodothiora populina]|uniref:Zn(2)-C6 fungal-type domain-containing protein n=1 Tax=Neodothiora populina TaxID=2781224 RepID=A0ABR3P4X7_9PEZI
MSQGAADGAASSPEPSGDLQSTAMSDSRFDLSQSDDKSPSTNKDTDANAKRNAKDPSRPRRKKARRACYACQRAHLTCGDERPCNRCIKRGLAEHCHDGVRKKAKYLHDAPNDALVPGSSAPYSVNQQTPASMSGGVQPSPVDMHSVPQSASYYPSQPSTASYSAFGQTPGTAPAGSPSTQDSPIMAQYNNQQPSMLSNAYPSGSTQQMNTNQDNMGAMNQTPPGDPKQTPSFPAPLFDPSDPSIFNFDISTFNFGNHYGAMEFGMLGHMSSAADGRPDVDGNMMNTMNQHGGVTYDSTNNNYSTPSSAYQFNNPYSTDWTNNTNSDSHQGSASQMYGSQIAGTEAGNGFDNFPNAFAIAEGTGSISSASPSGFMDFNQTGYVTSPANSSTNTVFPSQNQNFNRSQNSSSRQQHKGFLSLTENAARKKRRDPSDVYHTVTAPYSYTTGFHCLVAFVSKRFNPQKTLRIAKALASIRPSFISCSNKLTNDDLIFMEKLFQRTLYEYEGYMHALGTPTVLFRRTGEVASASKEFSLLSGWRKDVLLGAESNLNVNTGGVSNAPTGTSTRGTATPRVPDVGVGSTSDRPQPVFLAELIDEDSVIGFYEDFAKHAFGDARGTVSRRCKLLKYRTKEDAGWENSNAYNSLENDGETKPRSTMGNPLIMGEDGINALGVKDGKVDCMLSWTIKRDPFDVPMLIIVNFLPII